jgi:hypothetical protein
MDVDALFAQIKGSRAGVIDAPSTSDPNCASTQVTHPADGTVGLDSCQGGTPAQPFPLSPEVQRSSSMMKAGYQTAPRRPGPS